jgi:glycine hydroxymethyltransferase
VPKSNIATLVSKYEAYRNSTLNLIPSENVLSSLVLSTLGSPMAGRYAGKPESYGGSKIFHEIWEEAERLARKVFGCSFASVLPVSGHVAGMMAIDSVCKRGDELYTLRASDGGYKGYNGDYLPSIFGLSVSYIPFDRRAWNVDLDATLRKLEKSKPRLVILGGTVFLFPHRVREIASLVHAYDGRVVYDGSHVLGLIAGGCFQDPLAEGADILVGSTHKTLFGPQGGLILTNDDEIARDIADRALYTFVDNFHLNRVAALGVSLEETRVHGKSYAKRVVENSRFLAEHLHAEGVKVEGEGNGFTESHQVFLNFEDKGGEVRDKLETNRIIVDSRVRLGTNEITRRGMSTREMKEIANYVSRAISKPNDSRVRSEVRELVKQFRKIKFTLSN